MLLLSHVLSPLLWPVPIFAKYLPTLLNLTLAGCVLGWSWRAVNGGGGCPLHVILAVNQSCVRCHPF